MTTLSDGEKKNNSGIHSNLVLLSSIVWIRRTPDASVSLRGGRPVVGVSSSDDLKWNKNWRIGHGSRIINLWGICEHYYNLSTVPPWRKSISTVESSIESDRLDAHDESSESVMKLVSWTIWHAKRRYSTEWFKSEICKESTDRGKWISVHSLPCAAVTLLVRYHFVSKNMGQLISKTKKIRCARICNVLLAYERSVFGFFMKKSSCVSILNFQADALHSFLRTRHGATVDFFAWTLGEVDKILHWRLMLRRDRLL